MRCGQETPFAAGGVFKTTYCLSDSVGTSRPKFFQRKILHGLSRYKNSMPILCCWLVVQKSWILWKVRFFNRNRQWWCYWYATQICANLIRAFDCVRWQNFCINNTRNIWRYGIFHSMKIRLFCERNIKNLRYFV